MAFISSKELLATNDILAKRKTRHPKNEFQAYAYKLAMDLNDLINLKIYMRFAKNIERNLMEEAYRFVADSTSQQKGRLFFWKLKQLREQIAHRRALENFKYSFVLKKMKEFRNAFAKEILVRTDFEFDDETKFNITKHIADKKNILLIGGVSKKVLISLSSFAKLTVWEISSAIASKLKNENEFILNQRKIKIINKDILKKSSKKNLFDAIIINNFWQNIPIEAELAILKELKTSLAMEGSIFVNVKHGLTTKQEWKIYKVLPKTFFFFSKISNKKHFLELVEKLDFKAEEINCDNDTVSFLLTQIQ